MSMVCQRCHHENADEARYCFNCGAMLELPTAATPADPFIGKVLLGRYRILGLLGEGGMGKVYLAEQKMGTASRNVAIKTLLPELGADQQLVARFHRECETVIQLSHPNTVQFYDFGEIEGTLFIVMEYIEGESLAHVLTRGPIEPARADRILVQICGSLNEAHQRGIVHRDLKPENVLLTERGGQADFVKVLDFGIAKRSEAEDKAQAKLTKQGMVLGTPPYMSPEQFSGQQLDARSDIYSLGVMAYEMFTGRLPFEAATPWEWATKHLTTQPTPLEAHPGGVQLPEHKRRAIYRALAKERDQRQSTVLELMHELTGWADPSSAWAVVSAPAAMGVMPPTTGGQMPVSGWGAAQPRPAAPTPGPMSATDAAYAPTVATPSSGQMAATTGPGAIAGGAPRPAGTGLGKVVAILAVLGLAVVGGGAAGAWYLFSRPSPAGAVANTGVPRATATGGAPATTPADGPENVPSTPATTTPTAEATGAAAGSDADKPPAHATTTADTTAGAHTAAGEADQPKDSAEPAARKARDEKPRARRPRADSARVDALLAKAKTDLDRNDLGRAASFLTKAHRAAGHDSPAIRALQSALARKGSNQVGIFMLQGKCKDAQNLFRRLRAAGAEGPSRMHFSGDWCPRP